MDVVGTVLAVVLVAAFGYFIYTRVKKSKDKPRGGGGGGGGRPGGPPRHIP